MVRKVSTVLGEILSAIEIARQATAGKNIEVFRQDRIGLFAVERAIEIISEASRQLPVDLLD